MMKPVWAALALAASLITSGCVIGAPPGFSKGDRWTFPLAAPLEDGLILVPVKINGEGPYLFQIDPDSEVSSVDQAIFQEADLYKAHAERIADERDVRVGVQHAEVRTIEVGELTVTNRVVRVHSVDTYSFNGRRVRGLLGRDVIADSLVLTIDRDLGIGQLAVQGKQEPMPDAYELGYDIKALFGKGAPSSRKLVTATINDSFKVRMHLDLGSPVSLLRNTYITGKNMPRLNVSATLADELGTRRTSDQGTIAATVTVGKINAAGLLMLPYVDKRWRETDLDGALGADFFAPYKLMVNWHKKAFYFTRRDPKPSDAVVAARLGRWGKSISECKDPACVKITTEGGPVTAEPVPPPVEVGGDEAPPAPEGDATAGAPAPPLTPPAPRPVAPVPPPVAVPSPLVVSVARSEGAPTQSFEVLIEAIDDTGASKGLPRLLVTIPEGANQVMDELPADYAGASFRVIDLSPFARECPSSGLGCIWRLPQRR